jgi:hypothetical protein
MTSFERNAHLDRAVKLALPVAPCCTRCGYAIVDPQLDESLCSATGDPCSVPEAEWVMWRYELEGAGYFDGPIDTAGELWCTSDGPWLPVDARFDRGVLYRLDLAMRLAEIRRQRAERCDHSGAELVIDRATGDEHCGECGKP